ncbi:hypothetical protein [Providencia burhodogranariea]|uniref:Lipoprotein n=1 Tax=Providencia burhodogranariea DSM 19968 TaxID=1141662 RepID=K8WNG2_9GAMM|nr:hypothetical protein [Providencia burhodogranariea]EKT62158.1 hypothetical protein OOA_07907 [Providencia burhodogranariea DSM 19968]
MKKILTVVSCLLVTSCAMTDQELKQAYAEQYYQSPSYIAGYKERFDKLSVNEIAELGAKMDKGRMNGQSPMKVSDYLYIHDVRAQGNKVIYDYALTDEWLKLSPSKKEKYQQTMQKDLAYRTCSLKTVALAQEKGLEEVHQYYDNYPNHILFTLNANAEVCKQNGF